MNALVRGGSFWLIVTDETGPLSSTCIQGNWRPHAPEVLVALVRAAHPGLTVLGVDWAKEPRKYTISDEVLLVHIPGTHEVVKPAPKRRRLTATVDVEPADLERWDPLQWKSRENRSPVAAPVAAEPEVSAEVVNTCSCGIAYTAATWASLPLCGTKDYRDGNTLVHEDFRHCTCGSTRMIFTTTIAPERQP